MTQYLFRGKLSHCKEWIEGNLIISQWGKPYIYPQEVVEQDGHHLRFDSDAPFWVDPETVGQWTGLHDKNGVKIFALDIVLYKGIKCLVRWDDEKAGFFIGEDKYWMMNDTEIEVIGNAIDNSELLEV